MYTISAQDLGELVRTKRKEFKLTQNDLAVYSGTNQVRIAQLESGTAGIPTDKFMEVCRILCDDGTLFANWVIVRLGLQFFSEDDLEKATALFAKAAPLGVMYSGGIDE